MRKNSTKKQQNSPPARTANHNRQVESGGSNYRQFANNNSNNQKVVQRVMRSDNLQNADDMLNYNSLTSGLAPKTVKNSVRSSFGPGQDYSASHQNLPAGPSSSTQHSSAKNNNGSNQKNSALQMSRMKLPNSQSSNIFNSSLTSRQQPTNSQSNSGLKNLASNTISNSAAQLPAHHQRNSGSTGPGSNSQLLASKALGHHHNQQSQHHQQNNKIQLGSSHRQNSHHGGGSNTNYSQSKMAAPGFLSPRQQQMQQHQQQCGRTLAALDDMNQTQLKLRKTDSLNIKNGDRNQLLIQQPQKQSQQLASTQQLLLTGLNNKSRKESVKVKQATAKHQRQQQHSQQQQQQPIVAVQTNNRDPDDSSDQEQLCSALQMQPHPVPHSEFLIVDNDDTEKATEQSDQYSQGQQQQQMQYQQTTVDENTVISTQSDKYAKCSALVDTKKQQYDLELKYKKSSEDSRKFSRQSLTNNGNQVNIIDQQSLAGQQELPSYIISQQRTGSFRKETNQENCNSVVSPQSQNESIFTQFAPPPNPNPHTADSQRNLNKNNSTPELITPLEDNNMNTNNNNNPILGEEQRKDASVGAHLCCHEQGKQHAVLLQKVQFLTEQVSEEKKQAQMKELQYDKIIAALRSTAEENNRRKDNLNLSKQSADGKHNPNSQEWKDVMDELAAKKQQVNNLEEQVLGLELKAEKVALDHKISIQEKDDEISEEKLKLKHKESDMRQATAQIERLNDDIQGRIQESLDRQSDRLGNEKQADMDSMNRRNEQLIKQLVESHSAETRQLRDMLLQQERKFRDSEQKSGSLEIELRTVRMENNNRLDQSEIEEIQIQNQQFNEIRFQQMQAKFIEENQQLRDVIDQLETHINQLQESRSESDRKLIISDDKITELKKDIAKQKGQIFQQKDKEEKLATNYKAQIAKERKTADNAVQKMKGSQKLEQEVNKKQILINQLKAKVAELKADQMHKSKILLMKRKQIEDEKTVLIKKQASRQRSITRQNLSATRLQQQLETKEAVIKTERESKKALYQEKSKLEKEIATIKRDKTGAESSRLHNESMSMYFAKSQSGMNMFSPNARIDNNPNTKSFIANSKHGRKDSRHHLLMSSQVLDKKQLYLSQNFSQDRTSSVGAGSLHEGGDSMVNIVEFEQDPNMSPKSRGRFMENNSIILSTPFKNDEVNEGQVNLKKTRSLMTNDQHLKHPNQTKQQLQQSDKQYSKVNNNAAVRNKVSPGGRSNVYREISAQKPVNKEDEFIQVLSGCDSSNSSNQGTGKMRGIQSLKTIDKKQPGVNQQMLNERRRAIGKHAKNKSSHHRSQHSLAEQYMNESCLHQDVKHTLNQKQAPMNQIRNGNNATKTLASNSFIERGTASIKDMKEFSQTQKSMANPSQTSRIGTGVVSPHKQHMNMANTLLEQKMREDKESFVRTVLTARQKCQEFTKTIRQKDEHLQTGRNVAQGFDMTGKATYANNKAYQSSSEEKHEVAVETKKSNKTSVPNQRYGPQTHTQIRQINRNKNSDNYLKHQKSPSSQNSRGLSAKGAIPISKTPVQDALLKRSVGGSGMDQHRVAFQKKPKPNVTNATPDTLKEKQHQYSQQVNVQNMRLNSGKKQVKQSLRNNDEEPGLHFYQAPLINATSSAEDNSTNLDEQVMQMQEIQGSLSTHLVEENHQLKEQLELVKESLAAQQQKAETTELTMMDAIMQMKEQIQQVMVVQKPKQKAQRPTQQIAIEESTSSPEKTFKNSQHHNSNNNTHQHEEYLIPSRLSRNSAENEQVSTAQTKVPFKMSSEVNGSEIKHHQQSLRKISNSNSLRHRSETFDFINDKNSQGTGGSHVQSVATPAELEYSTRKTIKSPNKKQYSSNGMSKQNSIGGGANQANLYKQSTSSAMKRQSSNQQQMHHSGNINNQGGGTSNYHSRKQNSQVTSFQFQDTLMAQSQSQLLVMQNSASAYNTHALPLAQGGQPQQTSQQQQMTKTQRLSMGVLRQSSNTGNNSKKNSQSATKNINNNNSNNHTNNFNRGSNV